MRAHLRGWHDISSVEIDVVGQFEHKIFFILLSSEIKVKKILSLIDILFLVFTRQKTARISMQSLLADNSFESNRLYILPFLSLGGSNTLQQQKINKANEAKR